MPIPARSSAATAAAAAKTGHPLAGTAAQVQTAITDHALWVGFGRGFEVAAGIMLIALIVTIAAIRVKRANLVGGHTQSASPARTSERRDAQGRVTAERGPAEPTAPRAHRRGDGRTGQRPRPDRLGNGVFSGLIRRSQIKPEPGRPQ